MLFALLARKAANQGDRNGHPGCGGEKILHGESGHLYEMAIGCLTPIVLPVGVADETNCRVEGKVRGHRRCAAGRLRRPEVQHIQGQQTLEALNHISEDESHHAEGDERRGILGPALLGTLMDAAEPVGQLLQRAQHRMEKGPLAREELGHEDAQRFRNQQNQGRINHKIQSANRGHGVLSEPFRPQQRIHEISEKQQGGNASNDVVHRVAS